MAQVAAGPLDSPARVEEWISRQVAKGEVADLETVADEKAFLPPELRQVSGEFLQELLTATTNTHLHGVHIAGAVITDKLDLRNATISNDARIADAFVAQNVWFLNTSNTNSTVHFYGAKVGGEVDFTGARFCCPVNFILLNVGGNFNLSNAGFTNHQDLLNDTYAPSHYNADFGSIGVQGDALFLDTRFDCLRVSFKDATCQRLYLDRVAWPEDRARHAENTNRLRLEGLSYQHIRAITNQAERTLDDSDWARSHDETWHTMKDVLARIAPYSADAYDQLENFFQRDGKSVLADAVFVEKRRQERKRVLWPAVAANFPHGSISWFKSLALDGLVCYRAASLAGAAAERIFHRPRLLGFSDRQHDAGSQGPRRTDADPDLGQGWNAASTGKVCRVALVPVGAQTAAQQKSKLPRLLVQPRPVRAAGGSESQRRMVARPVASLRLALSGHPQNRGGHPRADRAGSVGRRCEMTC